MSQLEVNSIDKYSGNNLSVGSQLNLKSYDTTARDALTSVAGDMIYNTTTSTVQFYNGSAWGNTGIDVFALEFLIIAGGGAGGFTDTSTGNKEASGGGGAGGYLCKYASETSGGGSVTLNTFYVIPSTNYPVSIGAGGSGRAFHFNSSATGTPSYIGSLYALGGGGGGGGYPAGRAGGSGGGGGPRYSPDGGSTGDGANGTYAQGYKGGDHTGTPATVHNAGGGGGGAGAVGADGSSGAGGAGGVGSASSITGASVTRAGGGGGVGSASAGAGGTGGGGAGGFTTSATAGTANTGGGGGSTANTATAGASGGSGVIILRYPNTYTITQSGLTLSTATDGSDKVTTITAGTGTVSWA